jgi:hypothetical protein
VVVSEANRALETKDIMAPAFANKGDTVLVLHQLHPSRSNAPDCEKMFDTLGYGPLKTYWQDVSVEGLEGKGRECFQAYMAQVGYIEMMQRHHFASSYHHLRTLHAVVKVVSEMQGLLAQSSKRLEASDGDTLAIFGHAVFLNAVALAIGEAVGIDQAESIIQEFELGEAQGIVLTTAERKAELQFA